MGFDIECIIDIHTYPGEYFCPVCRTLVYPSEAFQSQCTHLYCKPCLAHIASGTRACPYDGYLVTESDSKPLVESDKMLAEKIGKVKVHCLYWRSGCTWEGTLSDCTAHCSGCTFGNSPVICNRCGIQIVHRQVHEHAQGCPGVYEGQKAVGGVSGVTQPGTTSSTVAADVNQSVAQSGAPLFQAQNLQSAAATLPVQNSNQQVSAGSQAPIVAPVAMPTPEQLYQQHYPQYYQQYMGNDPYQQTQQQSFLQHQQHPLLVQGQHQSQLYSQAVPQPHPQPQPQPNPVLQAPQQPHLQPQAQAQPQQVPSQGQAQVHAPVQGLAPNYQVNQQQQPHPPMRPQALIPPQNLPPPPQSQSSQPPPFAQAIGMRPPAQYPQVPQYQQPHLQMHYPQASQAHVPPQMHPQPQPHTQSSNQSHVQIQPQAQPHHAQSQPPIFPPQANQPTAPTGLPQVPHQAPAFTGHQSYHQPQPAQKTLSGASQQHQMHQYQASGFLYPVQVHGQIPQPPPVMRPPNSHGSLHQQQPSTLLPPQNQVPGMPPAQHQQFPPHAQQPTNQLQFRPNMHPVQQAVPQQYSQQQQFVAPLQLQQQGQFPQQRPMQPQLRPSGPPLPQQSQNYVGGPMMPNQVLHPQSHPLSSGGFGPVSHSGPAQIASTQTSISQSYAKSTVVEQNATVQETRSPSKGLVEMGLEGGESLKDVVVTGQSETVVKDVDNAAKVGLVKSAIKKEGNDVQGSLEQASGNSFEAGTVKNEICKDEGRSLSNSDSLKQVDLDNQKKLSEAVVAGPSSANFDKLSHTAVSASSMDGHVLSLQSHGFHQQGPQGQVQGQPSSIQGPQGPGTLPHAGQSLNPTEGRAPGCLGPPQKTFESQSTHGPALTTLTNPRGIMGRAPPLRPEGQFGPQQHTRPSEVVIRKDQMSGSGHLSSGSGEGGPFMRNYGDDPSFVRMNGGTAPDYSMIGSRDEKLKALTREHLNPFPGEPTRPLEQASRSLDKAPHGPIYDAGAKLDPGALGRHSRFLPPQSGHGHADMFGPGPEFGQHHMKHFAPPSPDREYLGSSPRRFGGLSSFPRGSSAFDDINAREAHRFGEGSRSFNLSSDSLGHPFRNSRFATFSGHLRRGDIDGPGNPRFGEHMALGVLHSHIGNDNVFGQDGPGHLMRGEYSGPGYLSGHFNIGETAGPGAFPGHGRAAELGGPGNFPRLPFNESIRGERSSFPHFGEPGMRNNYPLPGFPNSGNFAGSMNAFDQSKKRKPVSSGWCRICKLDCEAVEGLDMHSQTREHQRMAMDMVETIKLQNKKKQRTSAGHMMHEGGSRTRKAGIVGRGSKP